MSDTTIPCSICHKPVLGVGVVVGQPEEMREAGAPSWIDQDEAKESGVIIYETMRTPFVVLDPKCFHEMVDEVLRAESQTSINVSMGKMTDIREALEL